MLKEDKYIGKLIQEKYQIVQKIGDGGMACVYLAHQINLDRPVAIKILKESFCENEEFVKRFSLEAREMAGISHPNVVSVFDYGNIDGQYYIVMELLIGTTLDQFIKDKGIMTIKEVIDYVTPIADALKSIHKKNLVHRDIKSANIFITQEKRPVLMDFGIAFQTNKTISINNILGTAEYMSPEQAQGKKLSGRSDLYSLGIVIYECLSGKVPFRGDSVTSVITKVLTDFPEPLASVRKDIPKWLHNLVSSLLEKDPDKRPADADTVINILTNRIEQPSEKRPKITRKSKPHFLIGLLSLLILALTIVVLFFFVSPEPDDNNYSKTQPSDQAATLLKMEAQKRIENDDFVFALSSLNSIADAALEPEILELKELCINKLFINFFSNDLIPLEGGTFLMGSNEGPRDQKPRHEVNLNAFKITRYEISNEQFIAYLNAFNCDNKGYINELKVFSPEINNGIEFIDGRYRVKQSMDSIPAFGVTWNGANEFCKAFNGRLPTEAEWEYAAGGNLIEPELINASELNPIPCTKSGPNPFPCKIGSCQPNIFGLYDMIGNVWEWCFDFYSPDYYAVSPTENPRGPNIGSSKVIRGGDIRTPLNFLTPVFRMDSGFEGDGYNYIGFRMVVK